MKFAQADRFRAMGYAVAPVVPGETQPRGAWAVWQIPWNADHHADDGVGVLTHLPPPRSPEGIDARPTWLCALVLDAPRSKTVDAAIKRHLRWPEGCITTAAPVRVDSMGGTLRPFQLEGEPFPTLRAGAHVQVLSANSVIVASGLDAEGQLYTWQGGDPLMVPRSSLPVLNYGAARALLDDIEAAFERRGAVQ